MSVTRDQACASDCPPAVLVFGAESSGNHLAMDVLISCGCAGSAGDELDRQPFDLTIPPASTTGPICWGASLPRNFTWPDIHSRVNLVISLGYRPHIVVLTRSLMPTVASQLARGRVPDERTAELNIAKANKQIWTALASPRFLSIPYSVVPYEDLTRRPYSFVRWLMDRIDPQTLHCPEPSALDFVYDGNAKHWEVWRR